jgi:hypothetical protein
VKPIGLVKALVIVGCAALTLAGCATSSGKTSMVNGRAVSGLYDPARVAGLPVSEDPSGLVQMRPRRPAL